MTKELINKLQNRINNKVSISPIFKNDENENLLKHFLHNQNYLKPNKILSIININFLKKSPIGYALYENKKKIVGFLGTIFSERKIGDEIINQCYLHSWIVDSNYRTQAFRLIIPILEKKIFISTYSPIKSLEGLYKKLEFEEKNYHSKLVFSFPLKSLSHQKTSLSENKHFFYDVLSSDLKQIYEDHMSLKNNILFMYFNNNLKDHILIIVKKKYKKFFLPVLEIIYCSNLTKFKENNENINFELFKRFKTPIFMENFLNEESIFSKNILFKQHTKKRAYYKNIPKKFNFDFLYSELLD